MREENVHPLALVLYWFRITYRDINSLMLVPRSTEVAAKSQDREWEKGFTAEAVLSQVLLGHTYAVVVAMAMAGIWRWNERVRSRVQRVSSDCVPLLTAIKLTWISHLWDIISYKTLNFIHSINIYMIKAHQITIRAYYNLENHNS